MSDPGTSFDGFVRARGPTLLRFAYSLTGDGGLAEDLVQDALAKAYRRWDNAAAIERPEAYVRRIVVTTYISWHRRRSNREVPAPIPDRVATDDVEAFVQRDAVWRAMAELPRRQRAVLVLRYYEARPDAEIAVLLGCAEGTVRSLAARAFASLRREPEIAGSAGSSAPLREETR